MTEAKKIRYSDIVGNMFYKIGLCQDDKDLVDTFFTGSAHHLKRYHEAKNSVHKEFHLVRHRLHLRSMMKIIFRRGDFTHASDESNRDLDYRETWNPDFTTMPDPGMFRKMMPDWRFPLGEPHCADHYLHEDDFEHMSIQDRH